VRAAACQGARLARALTTDSIFGRAIAGANQRGRAAGVRSGAGPAPARPRVPGTPVLKQLAGGLEAITDHRQQGRDRPGHQGGLLPEIDRHRPPRPTRVSPSRQGRSCCCRVGPPRAPGKNRRRRCCRLEQRHRQGEGRWHRGAPRIFHPGAVCHALPATLQLPGSPEPFCATGARRRKALPPFLQARWRWARGVQQQALPRKHSQAGPKPEGPAAGSGLCH